MQQRKKARFKWSSPRSSHSRNQSLEKSLFWITAPIILNQHGYCSEKVILQRSFRNILAWQEEPCLLSIGSPIPLCELPPAIWGDFWLHSRGPLATSSALCGNWEDWGSCVKMENNSWKLWLFLWGLVFLKLQFPLAPPSWAKDMGGGVIWRTACNTILMVLQAGDRRDMWCRTHSYGLETQRWGKVLLTNQSRATHRLRQDIEVWIHKHIYTRNTNTIDVLTSWKMQNA